MKTNPTPFSFLLTAQIISACGENQSSESVEKAIMPTQIGTEADNSQPTKAIAENLLFETQLTKTENKKHPYDKERSALKMKPELVLNLYSYMYDFGINDEVFSKVMGDLFSIEGLEDSERYAITSDFKPLNQRERKELINAFQTMNKTWSDTTNKAGLYPNDALEITLLGAAKIGLRVSNGLSEAEIKGLNRYRQSLLPNMTLAQIEEKFYEYFASERKRITEINETLEDLIQNEAKSARLKAKRKAECDAKPSCRLQPKLQPLIKKLMIDIISADGNPAKEKQDAEILGIKISQEGWTNEKRLVLIKDFETLKKEYIAAGKSIAEKKSLTEDFNYSVLLVAHVYKERVGNLSTSQQDIVNQYRTALKIPYSDQDVAKKIKRAREEMSYRSTHHSVRYNLLDIRDAQREHEKSKGFYVACAPHPTQGSKSYLWQHKESGSFQQLDLEYVFKDNQNVFGSYSAVLTKSGIKVIGKVDADKDGVFAEFEINESDDEAMQITPDDVY